MMTLSYGGLGDIQKVAQSSGQVGFACTATFCYTSGAQYSGLFQRLQNGLMAVARMKKINTSITIDGRIGATTVNLAKAVIAKLNPNEVQHLYLLGTLEGSGSGITKETLSQHADSITPELETFAYGAPMTVATGNVTPPTDVPYGIGPGSAPPTANPYPDVMPQGTSVPTVPSVFPWGLTPNSSGNGYVAPSAGPQITSTPSSVYVPSPQVIVQSGPSTPLIAGVAVLGIGAVAAIIYALNKNKG